MRWLAGIASPQECPDWPCVSLGQSCYGENGLVNAGCGPGAVCAKGICTSYEDLTTNLETVGGSCDTKYDCFGPLECLEGKCARNLVDPVEYAGEGQPCNRLLPCDPALDLACSKSEDVCRKRIPENGDCSDVDCQKELLCAKEDPPKCRAPLSLQVGDYAYGGAIYLCSTMYEDINGVCASPPAVRSTDRPCTPNQDSSRLSDDCDADHECHCTVNPLQNQKVCMKSNVIREDILAIKDFSENIIPFDNNAMCGYFKRVFQTTDTCKARYVDISFGQDFEYILFDEFLKKCFTESGAENFASQPLTPPVVPFSLGDKISPSNKLAFAGMISVILWMT